MTQHGQSPFDANEHMMQLKQRDGAKKDYLPVQWRLVWFREQCPEGTIDTEEVLVDLDREMDVEAFVWNPDKRYSEKVVKTAKGYARFRAVVTDGRGGRATGTKSECRASFDDYIEKAETGAIGRALAALGYGTAFAPELSEEHRIVDSPVERDESIGSAVVDEDGEATPQQLASIGKLCQHLNKPVPEIATFKQAVAQLALLSAEYRTSRTKAS